MRALLPLLLLGCGACSVNDAEPRPARGPLGMYGTDAQLTASRPDAVLRYADHPRGTAELRMPAGKGPFPLAVIYHGGCFKTGIADQNYMAPLATRWQHLGVATLNVDYREVGDGGGWPGSLDDWRESAKLIAQVVAKQAIDPTRITLVGHSAGALPALWLTGPEGARGLTARSAIVLDGPGDLGREAQAFDTLCQFSSVAPFVGEPAAPRFAALAPFPALDDVLFVQAKLPAPPSPSLAAVGSKGARVTVRANPGASHFAVITPGDPIYAANEPAMLAILKAE